MRNVCVLPYDDHSTRFRTTLVSLEEDVEAVVHGFSEYTNGYQRLIGVRPITEADGTRMRHCSRRPLAIGVDNYT